MHSLCPRESNRVRGARIRVWLRCSALLLTAILLPSLVVGDESTQVINSMNTSTLSVLTILQTTGVYAAVVIGLCFCLWGLASEERKMIKIGGGIIIIVAAAAFQTAMSAFAGTGGG